MKRISGLVWMAVFILSAVLVRGEIFKDGETACFLGDSITNGETLSFVVLEGTLPRFVSNRARPILELFPIDKDLNQELLHVSGFAA